MTYMFWMLLTMAASDTGQDEKIVFTQGGWSAIIDSAKAQHKPIFIFAFAKWCGPACLMKTHTLSNQRLVRYFNEHFINFQFDFENDPGGRTLAQKFNIRQYAAVRFVDADERVIASSDQFLDSKQLLEKARAAYKNWEIGAGSSH